MEKFLVTGLSSSSSSQKLQLILPKGKHFEFHAVKNGEADLKTEALLDIAAKRRKSEASHLPPRVFWRFAKNFAAYFVKIPLPTQPRPNCVPAELVHCGKI